MSLKLKDELDKKSERDNDNLNTVLLKAVLQYLKKDPEVDKETLKELKARIKKLCLSCWPAKAHWKRWLILCFNTPVYGFKFLKVVF